MLLDGSDDSLKSALNILEIFGTLSGLKMNKEKTKLVWLGRKKHSKDKLLLNYNLKWNVTEFTLLGIQYNVDLNKMINKNYSKIFDLISRDITNWSKRKLTVLGKITLIKSLFLSKTNHILTTLPNPPETFLNKLNYFITLFGMENQIKLNVPF